MVMMNGETIISAGVLVVEDEVMVAKDLQMRLIRLGYEVAGIEHTGRGAVEAAGKFMPDLVMMDISLKGEMDGISAAEEIKKLYDIPVVFLTAFSHKATLERAKRAEPFGYLIKPLQERELRPTIEMALHKQEIERELKDERERFYRQSIIDPLTELYNRLYMKETVERFMNIHDRNEKDNVVALLFDLDHFKRINDTYGHGCGDEVLKKVGRTLIDSVRAGDVAVRYGGEEFAVFILGSIEKNSMIVAEKIRKKVSELTFDGPLKGVKVTLSAGVAFRRQGEGLNSFLERADKALYRAKEFGRNRVEMV